VTHWLTHLDVNVNGIRFTAFCGAFVDSTHAGHSFPAGETFITDPSVVILSGVCGACAPEIERQRALKDALRTLLLQHGVVS